MILALLFAASSPSVVDAENAFARDAQRLGQWSAFARYADTDAVMFNPQAVWARDFLKGRKNPPASVRWWPTHSFTSCDGRTAVNTGPWVTPDGIVILTLLVEFYDGQGQSAKGRDFIASG